MPTPAPGPGFDPERHAGRLAPAGAALALGGGCVGGWFGLLLAGVGLALLLVACLSRADGLLVLGPFVRAELYRTARTRRPWLWRAVYATAAGLILAGNVLVFAGPEAFGVNPQRVPIARMAAANATVTAWFAVVLFGYVSFLTVQLIAPIVAEEREAKRWEILLTTDLRAREILVGKVVGRLPQVLDPVLASLPVLAVTPLLGGTSPAVVLAVGGATLATVAGLSGVSAFYSLFAPTAGKATERVRGVVFAYVILGPLLYAVLAVPRVATFAVPGVGVTVVDVVDAVNAGNPIATFARTANAAQFGGGSFEDLLVAAAGRYALFHFGGLAAFGLLAIARLRHATPWSGPGAGATVVVADNKRQSMELKRKARTASARPPVGDEPVYWWGRYGELNAAQVWVSNRLTWAAAAGIAVGLVPVFGFVWAVDAVWPWGPGHVPKVAAGVLRILILVPGLPLVIGPLTRAARAIAQERAADTLEGLRLTALSDADILSQKWRAAAEAEMPLFRFTVALTAAGVVTGLVPVLGLLAVLVFYPAGAMVAAAVGLASSAWSRTPSGATTRVVVLAVVTYPCCYLAPPVAVGIGLWSDERSRQTTTEDYLMGALAVAGTLAWYGLVGAVAWVLAKRWFRPAAA